jgi:ATP-dependent protease ClpP protease subunit
MDTQYREIEITGLLATEHVPHMAPYANVLNAATVTTLAPKVIAEIDAAEAAGVRRLLLVVDSVGGRYSVARAIFDRIRAFSDRGGEVITYVRKASSIAPAVALAGDFIVLDPGARYLVHSMWSAAGEPAIRYANRDMAVWLASRTFLPAGELFELIDSRGYNGTAFQGIAALQTGFADELEGLERAREVAAMEEIPWTARRSQLAAKPIDWDGTEGYGVAPVIPTTYPAYTAAAAIETRAMQFASLSRTWPAAVTLPGGAFYHGLAFDGTNLVAVGDGGLVATSPDGGATWTQRTLSSYPSANYKCAIALGATIFIGGQGVIQKSTDGGVTWAPALTWIAGTAPYGFATDGTNVIAVGATYGQRSTDGGATWSYGTMTNPPGTGSLAVAYSGGRFCAVGTSGACKTSVDGGATWQNQGALPGAATCYSIAVSPTGLFVASKLTASVCYSYDGGVTWTEVAISTPVGWGITPPVHGLLSTGVQLLAFMGNNGTGPVGNPAAFSTDGINWRSVNGVWPNAAQVQYAPTYLPMGMVAAPHFVSVAGSTSGTSPGF